MMKFLEEKFSTVLSESIAAATERAYKKRPTKNRSTMSEVDPT